MPPRLLEAVAHEKLLADMGTARIEQHAFADFLARGELDRHLRRMRGRYRARRDALVAALAEALPEATVRGIAAGLHATVELPGGHDEERSGGGAPPADRASTRCATTRPAEDEAGALTMMLGLRGSCPSRRSGPASASSRRRSARRGRRD